MSTANRKYKDSVFVDRQRLYIRVRFSTRGCSANSHTIGSNRTSCAVAAVVPARGRLEGKVRDVFAAPKRYLEDGKGSRGTLPLKHSGNCGIMKDEEVCYAYNDYDT